MPDYPEEPNATHADLAPEQQRLIAILAYLNDWDKLNRAPISSVRDYRAGLLLFQAEAKELPAVKLNLSGSDGEEVWMEIPRLSKTPPPELPGGGPWLAPALGGGPPNRSRGIPIDMRYASGSMLSDATPTPLAQRPCMSGWPSGVRDGHS